MTFFYSTGVEKPTFYVNLQSFAIIFKPKLYEVYHYICHEAISIVCNIYISHISKGKLFIVVSYCEFSLVVCFAPYPYSNGKSILMQFKFVLIEQYREPRFIDYFLHRVKLLAYLNRNIILLSLKYTANKHFKKFDCQTFLLV